MIKWLLRVVGAFVVLVLVAAGVGLLLPSHFRVERSVEIAAPAGKIYGLIADPREWKRWTVWNQRDPNMEMDYSGPASGAGAKWSWQSKSEGSGNMEFTEARPGERIAYRLSFPEFGIESAGALTLAPAGERVRVTWTNDGDLGRNPVNRWFGLMMDGVVGADFSAGLANLKRLAEGT